MTRWIVAALLSGIVCVDAFAAEPTPIKALLITGGCCHDYVGAKESVESRHRSPCM